MIRCIECGQVHAIAKSGKVRGEQRYFCKDCMIYFTLKKSATAPAKKGKNTVTIQDLAKALGISFSTVSKALHNKADISPATIQKVKKMAEKMNYRPNLTAQSLVKSKSYTIGVIAPYIGNYFFPTIINGIQETARKNGYNLLVCLSHESYETEVANCNLLSAHRVDGIIMGVTSTAQNFKHIQALQKNNIPVVFVNRAADSVKASRVTVNDYQGAVKVMEHLIEQGCQRIAHIAGPSHLMLSKQRLKGYVDTLKKHGLPVAEELLVQTKAFMEDSQPYINRLMDLKYPPDAIFAYSDYVGIEVIKTAKKRGIRIPEELCVIGFSNDPVSEVIEPGLSTLSQPPFEMGQIAAEIMIQHIEEKADLKPVTRLLDFDLIIRQSSCKGGNKN